MDTTQIVLLSVISVLALALVVLGFQAFFTLRDLRKTLSRMNRLFDDANQLVNDIKTPVEKATNFFTALTAGASIINLLKKIKGNEREQK
jgi:uncharacterized protein YoxC